MPLLTVAVVVPPIILRSVFVPRSLPASEVFVLFVAETGITVIVAEDDTIDTAASEDNMDETGDVTPIASFATERGEVEQDSEF